MVGPWSDLLGTLNLGGSLVEPWWKFGGTSVEPWWNLGGAFPGPWWNLGGPFLLFWAPKTEPDREPESICPRFLIVAEENPKAIVVEGELEQAAFVLLYSPGGGLRAPVRGCCGGTYLGGCPEPPGAPARRRSGILRGGLRVGAGGPVGEVRVVPSSLVAEVAVVGCESLKRRL